jgi:hypothetical protein
VLCTSTALQQVWWLACMLGRCSPTYMPSTALVVMQ